LSAASVPPGRLDVVVVGSGIAGLFTVYELCRLGRSVVVLDRGVLGGGMTARTTAHLASQLDDFYHELIRMRGLEEAKLYFESQAAALDRTERIQATEEIGCDFHRLNGFLFAASEDHKLRQALTSGGFQMLILRVSGITNRAMMKHTAGTKIG
jgi:glycine/D-amino acid oxidase-like deaminating enzyme